MEKIKQSTMTLRQFLKRALECGLQLNKKKCMFQMTVLPYIEHILTSEVVKPDPKKLCAIRNMEAPRNPEEVRRFLGHVNNMAKLMPNLSAENEPLRRLLIVPNKEFCWGVEQRTLEKLLQYYAAGSRS